MMLTPARMRLLSALGLTLLFAVLAVVANRSRTPGVDREIDARLHRWVVDHPPWPRIAEVTGEITQPGNLRVVALLVAIGLFSTRRWRTGAWLLGTMAIGGLLVAGLKLLFSRPRPAWPDPITVVSGYSFPSSHAVNSALAAGCVIALLGLLPAPNRRQQHWIRAGRGAAVLFALLTGLDRMLLGVHYLTDVLAGWSLGAIVVLLTWSLLRGPAAPSASSRSLSISSGRTEKGL